MLQLKHIVRGGMLILLGAFSLLTSATAFSQSSLQEALKPFAGDAVKGYLQPVADLFGANMHSGFYNTADIAGTGFHLNIGIVGMAAMVGDDQKTYQASMPAGFSPATASTATIFGEKGIVVPDAAHPGFSYKAGPDGIFNTKMMPLAVPQLTLGRVYGTELIVRYLPMPKIGDGKVPQINLWGIGVRHSVSQYLPKLPVDLSAGIFYHSFKAEDHPESAVAGDQGLTLEYKGLSFGAQASKSFSILTLYGGLAYESSTFDVSYYLSDIATPVQENLSLDGANKFRFTGGLSLSLGFMKLFADANFGSVTCFSGGIGFGN